jgi:hypothetical protein
LLNRFPGASYTIVDVEPAIGLSRAYLTSLFPSDRLTFLTPAELASVGPRSVDLALSISSLQEMTDAQNRDYVAELDRVAGGGVVYLKQWRRWRNPMDGNLFEFDALQTPSGWQPLYRRRAAVQTRFVEAAWRLR